jgi:hypothetical protein
VGAWWCVEVDGVCILECGVVVVCVVNVVGHDVGGGVVFVAIWVGGIWGIGGVVLIVWSMSVMSVVVGGGGGVLGGVALHLLLPS